MERISLLLDKIRDINKAPQKTVIDLDLMLDYTRVIYADLLEWKNKLAFSENIPQKENNPRAQIDFTEPEEPQYVTAPSVELENTSRRYATTVQETPFDFHQPSALHPDTTDIRAFIDLNDRYAFIRELFMNDTLSYEQTLSELNSFDNEEEAVRWLNQAVFADLASTNDSTTLHTFYQLVGTYFENKH